VTIACFCGYTFHSTRSAVCGRCGEPVLVRERHETPEQFGQRMASHRRTEDEIRALPETAHPGEVTSAQPPPSPEI
jgi:DNA-directed RNA polymerase subunit RPC12/RpoP